ncbi:MAG: hypothetical protein EYC69_11705 [Bacteroidetes bacterium]|nr:MAG: hypothetical protein EYC69_11705 [Bacteroidota bacterium]
MNNNQKREEGPILRFETFDVIPRRRGRKNNKHLDNVIEKLLSMEPKTKVNISKIDIQNFGLCHSTIRYRLEIRDQLGRYSFKTLVDANKNKIGYTVYCVA